MRGWGKFHTQSIRFKLVVNLLVLTVPLLAILFVHNFYAIEVVRNQVANSYKNLMTLYMNQIDHELDNVDQYMNNVVALDRTFFTLEQANTENDYWLSKILMSNKLKNDILMFPSITAFFVYSEKQQDILDIYNDKPSYREVENINAFIINSIENLEKEYISNRWHVYEIQDTYYWFQILKSGDLYFGAWVNTDKLMDPLKLIDLGEQGGIIFANDRGEAIANRELIEGKGISLLEESNHEYYMSGANHEYLVVKESSKKGDVHLIAIIPDDKILENLPYLQRIIWLIVLAAIIVIPLGLFILKQTVLTPLNRLVTAMRRLQDGNLNLRLDDTANTLEFRMVNETFNKMIQQIEQLTIEVYEEKLSKQREELQRLQLQINPHFFLNTLNIIYSLAKTQKYELIQEMARCLMNYFRFMFKSNLEFVQLQDELRHTKNYLRIQKLRFPGHLTSEIAVPDFLLTTPVPPLIVQTFVENSVKHGLTLDESIHISIQIDFFEYHKMPYVKIVIADTGVGFSSEILDKLNTGEEMSTDQGEHIGIWNVMRRLRLLYKKETKIYFANQDEGGAIVSILIPMHPDERKE